MKRNAVHPTSSLLRVSMAWRRLMLLVLPALAALALVLFAQGVHAAGSEALVLGPHTRSIDTWSATTVLVDQGGKLDAAAPINVDALVAAGICSRPRDGVKILGVGELKAKLAFEVAGASGSARAAIEKAGGSLKLLAAEAAEAAAS